MADRGRFITFEGVEGSGKSTQILRLADWLREQGRHPEVSRDPGGTAIGSKIRQILLDPENKGLVPRAELLLYAADRAQHVDERIRPWLAAGSDVLCDRFIHSTLAYQGFGRGLDLAEIKRLNDYATGGLQPDLVILLDLDPALGLQRARKVGKPDRLEQEALEFHERVRQGFLKAQKGDPKRIIKVSAELPPEAVSQLIIKRVATLCGIVR